MNSKSKYLYLLLLLTSFTKVSTAQKQFLPGFIVTEAGDTIRGQIDYRNWEINPKTIVFRIAEGQSEVTYTPTELRSFFVNNEIYLGAEVDIETGAYNDLTKTQKEFILERVSVFLELIIEGPKSLLAYHIGSGKTLFYVKQDSLTELLLYKRYLSMTEQTKGNVVENKRYLGQLALYLQGCPSIQKELQHTQYKQNQLVKLFNKYYTCSGEKMSFLKKIERVKLNKGLLVGISSSKIKFSGTRNFDFLNNADFGSSISPSGGFFLDFVLPRNNGKWSIYNEFLFSHYSFSAVYEDRISANQYTVTSTTFSESLISVINCIRFHFPGKSVRAFVNAGPATSFSIHGDNNKKKESTFYSTTTTEEGDAIGDISSYRIGFMAGAGVQVGKFSVNSQYLAAGEMTRSIGLSAKSHSFLILLGYRF